MNLTFGAVADAAGIEKLRAIFHADRVEEEAEDIVGVIGSGKSVLETEGYWRTAYMLRFGTTTLTGNQKAINTWR